MFYKKSFFEIVNIKENEVLVDGLTFEDMAEQFKIYQNFYGEDAVVAYETIYVKTKPIFFEEEYKKAYINYFEELQNIGNL